MNAEIKNKLILIVQATAAALLFVLLSVLSFSLMGSVVKQLAVAVFGSLLVCFFSCFSKRSQTVTGIALTEFIVFLLITALSVEAKLQIEAGWVRRWIFFFYYDKLLIVGTVWLSCVLFFALKRLLSRQSSEYERFFEWSSTSFAVFYSFLLVYSFVLLRLEGTNDNNFFPLNLSLLSTTKMYFELWAVAPYEVFMMLCGNLFYFTPLGYIFCIKLRKRKTYVKLLILIFFPLIAFSLIEYTQYVFQVGYCEIDDMLMNTFGFWLGAALHPLSNVFASKVTKQKIKYFWG